MKKRRSYHGDYSFTFIVVSSYQHSHLCHWTWLAYILIPLLFQHISHVSAPSIYTSMYACVCVCESDDQNCVYRYHCNFFRMVYLSCLFNARRYYSTRINSHNIVQYGQYVNVTSNSLLVIFVLFVCTKWIEMISAIVHFSFEPIQSNANIISSTIL